MAELQHGLWVVKTEERYEPTFSYRWDLLEQWLPEAVAEGRRLSRPAAIERLITRYASAAVYTSERILTRLFGLTAAEIRARWSDFAGVACSLIQRRWWGSRERGSSTRRPPPQPTRNGRKHGPSFP